MRVLITGGAGFVGTHAVRLLQERYGSQLRLASTSKSAHSVPLPDGCERRILDITDAQSVLDTIESWQPTHILHLAGIAAPIAASTQPDEAWRVHVFGARNLGRAILEKAPHCTLLHVGSGLIYGGSARSSLALDENAVLDPLDEYGVTKAAADLAMGVLAAKGLKVIRLRPFNHTGPGQSEDFVVPAFAMQIARIEAGLMKPVLRVGNLEAERDFLDVRDVVGAYLCAIDRSPAIAPGSIYNIASGEPRRISDILETMLSLSSAAIAVERDEARMRPSDIPRVIGNSSKAHAELGWSARHSFAQTLQQVLDDCRRQIGNPFPT
ncbi:NAD-dependent epimerase/dehydratase [Devosia sp. LC5]|uniref:GDP-mannose 4,6-dehydratase n=1 Tax=Devosia sp. LC5 TaxID=1502724 RepID=UPI0004E34B46|nr:GDP-mannose 4,6-dehydratase [Devosia sp. LC5]KFC64548.1 NAD-dependent epimerase/dehydratase [Devosia sp. LC5]